MFYDVGQFCIYFLVTLLDQKLLWSSIVLFIFCFPQGLLKYPAQNVLNK